jgi:predicted nucleotidyltransferase
MTQLTLIDIDKLIQRFDKTDVVQALILMGSYARNEAGPHSDIDLVRFVIAGTHFDEKKRIYRHSNRMNMKNGLANLMKQQDG